MSDQLPASLIPNVEPASPARRSGPTSSFETWMMAVTRPSQQTYQAIANSPAASTPTAVWWSFLASLIGSLVLRLFSGQLEAPLAVVGALMSALFQACMVVVSFLVLVWLLNLVARPFGGRASYVQVAYTIAAINFPLTICTAIPAMLRGFPYPGAGIAVLLELLLICYQLILIVTAVKAVHQVSWVAAIVAAIAAPAILVVGAGAILYFAFRLWAT